MPDPDETAVASEARGVRPALSAYPAFLLSLTVPGLAQLFLGVGARGAVLLGLALLFAAGVVLGHFRLPVAAGFAARDAAALYAAALVWTFAAYDAWFRARENANGMAPLLGRTPRVAAFADLLWGGAGHLYLGRLGGAAAAVLTAVLVGALLAFGTPTVLVSLVCWNGGLALLSYHRAQALYHHTPSYEALRQRLEREPFDSPRAPSPSLPMATLVAALIAFMGASLLPRALSDPPGASAADGRPIPAPAMRVDGSRFRDTRHGIEMSLPGPRWSFTTGEPPFLLTGHDTSTGESFTLAAVDSAFFGARGVLPPGALSGFARRREADLAAQLPGFRLLSRAPEGGPNSPGGRIVYVFRTGGTETLCVQEIVLLNGRLFVLTLAGSTALGPERLTADFEALRRGIAGKEPGP